MATDLLTTERTRRGILAAAVGVTGAAVAASVARIAPVSATDGDLVTVGSQHEGEDVTGFKSADTWALSGESDSSRGVMGTSNTGQGVHGASTESAGVAGTSEIGNGVHGTSTSNRGVWGESTSGNGVVGAGVNGVVGTGTTGVHGSGSSVGVKAESSDGFAVHTTAGRIRFDGISGVATILEGDTRVTLTPDIAVGAHTLVLLTPHVDLRGRDCWFSIPSGGSAININISESRGSDVRIAYLILDDGSAG
jgi:hypothetical protein